jgi:microcystin-dependent protein
MADAFTPNYGWTLPEVGASRDSWGAKLNTDLSSIDQLLFMAAPIGMLLDYAGSTAPSGYLICDGRAVSRATYSALFAVIGTAFGAGDGSTTFALPNLIGRSSVGPGTMTDQGGTSFSFTFATYQGYGSQTITQSNLPNYNLTSNAAGTHNHGGATAAGANHYHTTDTQGTHTHGGTTDVQGDHSHGVNDPGHAHGYTLSQIGAGARVQYGTSEDVVNTGQTTSVSGTGISIQNAGSHAHNITTSSAGAHSHTTSYSGNLTLGINSDGSHTHTIPLGGGGVAMTIQNPVAVVTKIIYAGTQAATMSASAAATTTRSASTDEMTALRDEIEQLRALILSGRMPPRVQRAPLRGMH